MTSDKLSMRRIYLLTGAGLFLTTAAVLLVAVLFTDGYTAVIYSAATAVLLSAWFVLFVFLVRKKLVRFSTGLCQTLDDMMNGRAEPQAANEAETLFSKINHRLIRLYEMLEDSLRRILGEKEALQELTSDISHQVKTPMANLKMVTSTLLEQKMPEEKRREFLIALDSQLDKLEFLMQAMVKTSRLETGIISLVKKSASLYETLAAALGGIFVSAEKKNIRVTVDCPENLTAPHDTKWTGEALFNILDNAVKYSPEGGSISVMAQRMEMYTKIDITDNGKGISENHHASVFKRFYREEEVHGDPGIGIGLYLAREIITLQGGYIKLLSEPGKGSTFSVFLPNT